MTRPVACRIEPRLRETLSAVAAFYDRKKVGDNGFLGFRRSTDLTKLCSCLFTMIDQGLIVPEKSNFIDLGCADGRVNLLLSYLVRLSVGVELNEWILEEYEPLRSELERALAENRPPSPPQKILLLHFLVPLPHPRNYASPLPHVPGFKLAASWQRNCIEDQGAI